MNFISSTVYQPCAASKRKYSAVSHLH